MLLNMGLNLLLLVPRRSGHLLGYPKAVKYGDFMACTEVTLNILFVRANYNKKTEAKERRNKGTRLVAPDSQLTIWNHSSSEIP